MKQFPIIINNIHITKYKGLWRIPEYPWYWARESKDLIPIVNYIIMSNNNVKFKNYGKK